MPGLPPMIPIPYDSNSKGYEYIVKSTEKYGYNSYDSVVRFHSLLYLLVPPKSFKFTLFHTVSPKIFERASRRS